GTDPHAGAEDPGEVEGAVPGMLREVRDIEGRGVLVREAQHGGEPVLRARERERGHASECTVPPGHPRRGPTGAGTPTARHRSEDRHRAVVLTCGQVRGRRAAPGPAQALCSPRISSAARSPISIVVMFGFTATSCGITEASTT